MAWHVSKLNLFLFVSWSTLPRIFLAHRQAFHGLKATLRKKKSTGKELSTNCHNDSKIPPSGISQNCVIQSVNKAELAERKEHTLISGELREFEEMLYITNNTGERSAPVH